MRARTRRDNVLPRASAFHIALRADCISPKTPEAAMINVTMPVKEATMLVDLPAAPSTAF